MSEAATGCPRADVAWRRGFIGGSDARIIMGEDENALLRLWREKRGEAEPEDLSGNLIVRLSSSQVGASTAVVTQHLFPLLYPATSEAQTFAPAVLRKKLNPGCLESLLHCLDG